MFINNLNWIINNNINNFKIKDFNFWLQKKNNKDINFLIPRFPYFFYLFKYIIFNSYFGFSELEKKLLFNLLIQINSFKLKYFLTYKFFLINSLERIKNIWFCIDINKMFFMTKKQKLFFLKKKSIYRRDFLVDFFYFFSNEVLFLLDKYINILIFILKNLNLFKFSSLNLFINDKKIIFILWHKIFFDIYSLNKIYELSLIKKKFPYFLNNMSLKLNRFKFYNFFNSINLSHIHFFRFYYTFHTFFILRNFEIKKNFFFWYNKSKSKINKKKKYLKITKKKIRKKKIKLFIFLHLFNLWFKYFLSKIIYINKKINRKNYFIYNLNTYFFLKNKKKKLNFYLKNINFNLNNFILNFNKSIKNNFYLMFFLFKFKYLNLSIFSFKYLNDIMKLKIKKSFLVNNKIWSSKDLLYYKFKRWKYLNFKIKEKHKLETLFLNELYMRHRIFIPWGYFKLKNKLFIIKLLYEAYLKAKKYSYSKIFKKKINKNKKNEIL